MALSGAFWTTQEESLPGQHSLASRQEPPQQGVLNHAKAQAQAKIAPCSCMLTYDTFTPAKNETFRISSEQLKQLFEAQFDLHHTMQAQIF